MTRYVRKYLIDHALNASPGIIARFCANIPDTIADQDQGPDLFTLREVLAHLADWEPIWLERIQRIVQEDMPVLPNIDEGKMAELNDYATTPVEVSLEKFATGRAALTAYLASLPNDAFERSGIRPEVGTITVKDIATLVLAHDTYHIAQLARYTDTPQSAD
jgi:uncharacterized damage-inducible protein DinB